MKFGVREICDVVFKAKASGNIGSYNYSVGQPVLYIDSAKTSTIEGAASTVYATGGRGNSRLVAWEGEKTLTFTVEDALLSPMGFAMLSGAGLFEAPTDAAAAYVHTTAIADLVDDAATITLDGADEKLAAGAPLFIMEYSDGSIGKVLKGSATYAPDATNKTTTVEITLDEAVETTAKQVFVDFYLEKTAKVTELQIDAENFAGYYYVEASTLFRRESDGKDLPAEIVFPKVKIQSNFTFTMASSGDPSTFTFTMDALPAYTMFNKNKKALCAIQVIDDSIEKTSSVPVTMNAAEFTTAEGTSTEDDYGDSGTVTKKAQS